MSGAGARRSSPSTASGDRARATTSRAAARRGAAPHVAWPDGSTGLRDGDVVVVTSKVVSKAEGRVVAADGREDAIDGRDRARRRDRQTPRGDTRIVADARTAS